MKKFALCMTAALSVCAAQAQVKWDLPTGYGANSFQTQNVQQFATDVDKLTGGKLKITLHPGGSLYKANEIKRAVQTGQVPSAEFILSGASNENPLFGVDSIPFLATSYADSKRLYLAAKPAQEKLLASQGVKVLFTVPWPGQSLYSLKPVSTPADFAGTKMRAYNPATTRIAERLLETGAVQAVLTMASDPADRWKPLPVLVTPASFQSIRPVPRTLPSALAITPSASSCGQTMASPAPR